MTCLPYWTTKGLGQVTSGQAPVEQKHWPNTTNDIPLPPLEEQPKHQFLNRLIHTYAIIPWFKMLICAFWQIGQQIHDVSFSCRLRLQFACCLLAFMTELLLQVEVVVSCCLLAFMLPLPEYAQRQPSYLSVIYIILKALCHGCVAVLCSAAVSVQDMYGWSPAALSPVSYLWLIVMPARCRTTGR